MPRNITAVALALVSGVVFAAGANPPPGDLGGVQGNWKPLQVEFEGKCRCPPKR